MRTEKKFLKRITVYGTGTSGHTYAVNLKQSEQSVNNEGIDR